MEISFSRMFKISVGLIVASQLLSGPIFPKDPVSLQVAQFAAEGNRAQDGSRDVTEETENQKKDHIMKASIRYSVLFGVPINVYLISMLTWDWGNTRPFSVAREGTFEQHSYAGGADKMGHLYSHYLFMRIFYNVYNYTESGRPSKWGYSIGLTSLLSIGIELGDAFAEKQNGFSYTDLLFGMSGMALGAILERFPAVDSFIGFSVEYFPTKYFREHPSKLKWFMDDYSGWKFMINIKLAGFKYVGLNVPEFMRYIMIDIGYFTTGFTEYDNKYGHMLGFGNKERDVFIGISVNLAEVIKDFFKDKDSLACRAVQQPFKYYHVPAGYKHNFKL